MTKQSQGLFLFYGAAQGAAFCLHVNDGAGVQIPDPVTQAFLQHGVLLLSGAVAGEVAGGVFLQLAKRISKLPSVGIHADEVEAAEEHIRTEPAEDVQQSLVGTAAEAVFTAVFLQQQILFVEIVIVHMDIVLPDGLAEDAEREGAQQIIAGAQGDALGDFQHILHTDQPGIFLQGRIQTDVFSAAEVFSEGVTVYVDRRMVIDLQEPFQTAAVVVVTVGEDAQIHLT